MNHRIHMGEIQIQDDQISLNLNKIYLVANTKILLQRFFKQSV